MQQDAVEVSFCDLCGTSIPVTDLAAGTALRHQGKTIGACCLPALRGAGTVPGPAGAAQAMLVRPSAPEVRILPVAIVLLAAMAAATLFLDQRLSTADTQHRQALARVAEAQTSDSQVLAGLAVAMDAVPRRPELDTLVAKVNELAAVAEGMHKDQQARLGALEAGLASVGKVQSEQAGAIIDYRPLIEDLRQRQLRLVDLVSTLRAVVPVAEANPAAAPTPAQPAETPGAPALAPALAEQVKKLQSADPAVRFEAVDELLRSKEQAVLPHLLPLTRDADAFVRRLTVEGLSAWKRADAVEALLAALADADEYVRDTAWRSLKDVTGQKIPFESAGTKDARARGIGKWQEWWEKNKATFGA